ncbi:MAG TPA: molybdopterin dinucleotide binding domain-containing protein [Spirochaetota bacterium]|nr:molybdopterin dinucleotide binding domain-containing protein [Spirochaetota bacterium]HQH99370.1 molybdopterin dinucleotide binding domain-containing protein [Spirochaetota bacterium]
MGLNPLVTMTDPAQTDRALERVEYVVVSDFFMTPTAQRADLLLPASTWLERDDVMNIHKHWCFLAQRRVAIAGDTRDDRDVMIDLERCLGLRKAFSWKDYPAFPEWMLQGTGISFDEFCERGILTGPMKYFKYRDSGFATESGKFDIYSRAPEKMGEFRQIPSLRKRQPEPQAEINPATATGLGLREGDRVWIESPRGRVAMKEKLFDGIAPGVVSAPHAWWFPEEEAPVMVYVSTEWAKTSTDNSHFVIWA